MGARMAKQRDIKMAAPYLSRVWFDASMVADPTLYPFTLPMLTPQFEIKFERPITIFVGENGVGKSTLIEGIAALAGYDDAGGGKGYRPVDHAIAKERSGGSLAEAFKAAWRPKITDGWFFKAESFFSVARYLDEVNSPYADFLSHSHGEGFMRFFEERLRRQGIYFFDEPESALSPSRQIEFLRILNRMQESTICQVIMATHSPLLMVCPGADLRRITHDAVQPVTLEQTDHFRLMRDFCTDPEAFVSNALYG